MRNCRNCYYRSIIGFESWCCHPAIGNRIRYTDRKCADHIYFDFKGPIDKKKTGYCEIIKRRTAPKVNSYRITHAGTAIECKHCGLTSFSPHDIELKFCGKCRIFHDEE